MIQQLVNWYRWIRRIGWTLDFVEAARENEFSTVFDPPYWATWRNTDTGEIKVVPRW